MKAHIVFTMHDGSQFECILAGAGQEHICRKAAIVAAALGDCYHTRRKTICAKWHSLPDVPAVTVNARDVINGTAQRCTDDGPQSITFINKKAGI